MKLPNSQITTFSKKQLSVFYTDNLVNLYHTVKHSNPNIDTAFYYKTNLLKVDNFIFKYLVEFDFGTHTISGLSHFRKGVNEDGDVILVEIAEDLKRQNKITRLGQNLFVFDINFLRKEKIYAKLKYSRSPQYDIVSGGIAAIFSGFLGFLICEKFGLELLDSGDFYTAFMYGVFIVFAVRPLVRVINGFNKDKTYTPTYNILSPQPLFQFYSNLLKMFFKLFK